MFIISYYSPLLLYYTSIFLLFVKTVGLKAGGMLALVRLQLFFNFSVRIIRFLYNKFLLKKNVVG